MSSEKKHNKSCSITKFISHFPEILTKKFYLDSDGKLQKESGGQLVEGECEILKVAGPKEFAELLLSAKKNEAFAYGTPNNGVGGHISTKSRVSSGELTRSRKHFSWPSGPGIMMLDYDPAKDCEPLSHNGLWESICNIFPEVRNAPFVICKSTSTEIHNTETGECLIGAGGLRIYLFVQDASDIPRAGKALTDGLWAAGHGRYVVSKSGARLERTLVDAAVWQPERLDFIAGAACFSPLRQKRGKPFVGNNDAQLLDTKIAFKSVTDTEALRKAKEEAFRSVELEQKEVRAAWIKERVKNAQNGSDEPITDTRRANLEETYSRAVNHHQLLGDFELIAEDGQRVTVAEILDDPDHWHECRFADPLEPDYQGDHRIAWANLKSGGKPYLYSHAHGGQKFVLIKAKKSIKVVADNLPRVVSTAEGELARTGSIYQRGGQLVRVIDSQICPVTAPWLRNELEEAIQFLKFTKGEWVPRGCPRDIENRILHNRGAWMAHELHGVVRAPLLRPDGSILSSHGYDETTKLLLIGDPGKDWPTIPKNPSSSLIYEALHNLMKPFQHYPFVTPVDRSVLLCALFTSVQRPILDAAPGFSINAHAAGSGKGKLAKSVSLVGGQEAVESPWPREGDEQRKTLLAKLMESPQSLLLDNVVGALESDVLCAILTARRYEDRLLGASQRICVPTNTLILITGNNTRLVGDLNRRILTCTIDHGVERPDKLQFPFDPVEEVRKYWLHYRMCALTILRGFISAGSPQLGSGTLGSFEVWDRQIRQCVIWLMNDFLLEFELADPADSITANFEEDPATAKIRALMLAWYEHFSSKPVTVRDLIHDAEASEFGHDGESALHFVLDEIAGEGSKINPRRLGRWIERNSGRVVDGMRIVDTGRRPGGYKQWQIFIEKSAKTSCAVSLVSNVAG